MEQHQELLSEIKKLREGVDRLSARYNTANMLFGGVLRGVGILIGATLLVLAGGAILNLLGLLPGLSDVVEIILNAFEKANVS